MEKKHIPSAMPLYCAAAAFALGAVIRPMYTWSGWILSALLAAAAYIVTKKYVFKGRDIEVEGKVDTGSRETDKLIEEGRAQLNELHSKLTGDANIDDALERMYTSGRKIFDAIAEKPEKASQIRKFMNYYLPTTTKLMAHYRTLSDVAGGEHVEKALSDVRSSMGMIAQAFEKQLDNLYRLEAMDVSTDIDVMESMITADGLTDDGIRRIVKEDNK